MKAAVINSYGSPEVFEITDIPKPEIFENELLIKVKASSINPVDYKIRKGNLKLILGSKFPIVLGFDVAGEVVKAGSKVSKFKKGDLVYGRLNRKYGRAYAEYAAGSESVFALKPENISFEEAAAIPLAGLTALQAFTNTFKLEKGHQVLINGASGGVGHFAIQIVKLLEAECTAVCSSSHGKMLSESNVENFIDYSREDFKNSVKEYDVIFDVVGKESFLTCRHILKPGGVYITSLPRPKLIIHRLISYFTKGKVKTLLMKSRGSDLEFLNGLINDGKFKVFIDKVFSLEEIADAHAYCEKGHVEGKVVVRIS